MYNLKNPREHYQYDELVGVKNRVMAASGGWCLLMAGTLAFAILI